MSSTRAVTAATAVLVLLLVSALAAPAAVAQQEPASPEEPRPGEPPPAGVPPPAKPVPDRNARRLFQRFVEDAAITPGGWIEGQYLYDNLSNGASHYVGPLISFKVVKNVEAGLRFGFLDLRPDSGPDRSGLSDIDLYAKYRLPGGRGRFAFGGLVKAATADENKGLGTGKADLEAFGAYRADLDAVTLVASFAARFNGQPDPSLGTTRDSVALGGGILLPATPAVTFVVEGTYESRRFAGGRDDARLTVGMQAYRHARRGGFRAAVALPLSDGAPDLEIRLGVFLTY